MRFLRYTLIRKWSRIWANLSLGSMKASSSTSHDPMSHQYPAWSQKVGLWVLGFPNTQEGTVHARWESSPVSRDRGVMRGERMSSPQTGITRYWQEAPVTDRTNHVPQGGSICHKGEGILTTLERVIQIAPISGRSLRLFFAHSCPSLAEQSLSVSDRYHQVVLDFSKLNAIKANSDIFNCRLLWKICGSRNR